MQTIQIKICTFYVHLQKLWIPVLVTMQSVQIKILKVALNKNLIRLITFCASYFLLAIKGLVGSREYVQYDNGPVLQGRKGTFPLNY